MIVKICAALAAMATFAAMAQPTAQAPSPLRGREIFYNGLSSTGTPIKALVGAHGNALPGNLFACANCHGEDGRGQREGGIRSANITRTSLGNAAVAGARSRPSYTRTTLERAIVMGRDAAGNRLDYAMPRYRMSGRDIRDLLSYLDRLGGESPTGVSARAIHINLIGAPTVEAPAQAIYGRRIVLGHERSADAFMTIDASADGSASIEAAERDHIPTIVLNAGRALPGHYAFVLSASKDDQVAALRNYAKARNVNQILLNDDCDGLEDSSDAALALMTIEAAKHCDLASVPLALDRKIVVSTLVPPTAADDNSIAQAELSIVVTVLEQIGHDFNRNTFLNALEHSYRINFADWPPVTWTSNQRFGSSFVWLMTLDLQEQSLLGSPGWSSTSSKSD